MSYEWPYYPYRQGSGIPVHAGSVLEEWRSNLETMDGVIDNIYNSAINQIALGATGLGSNTAVYGNSSITKHVFQSGYIGVGTATPVGKVDIVATSATETLLRVKTAQSLGVLGDDIVTNGTFESNASWTWGTGWSYNSTLKRAEHTPGNTAALSQSITTTDATVYQISFSPGISAGSIQITIGSITLYNETSSLFTSTASYTKSFLGNATGSVTLSIVPSSDFDGSFDSLSIKPVIASSQASTNYLDENGTAFASIRGNAVGGYASLAFGVSALRFNTTGYRNLAVGESLVFNCTGHSNVGIGRAALYYNTSGCVNTAIGGSALQNNIFGNYNMAIGYGALLSCTSGTYNAAIGSDALGNLLNTNCNVAIGGAAGYYISGGGSNATPIGSVYIGYNTRASADGNTNEIVIGYNAVGNGSNSVTLGSSSITKTILQGNVGTGTSSPAYGFHVSGSTSATIGMAVTNTSTNSYAYAGLKLENSSANSGWLFLNSTGATGYAGAGSLNLYTGNAIPIGICTNNTLRVFIGSDGKVAIGNVTSPTALLDINSDILRLRTSKTPANAGASGNAGDHCWDSGYLYVCVAANTWKRVAIASW